MTFLAFAKYLVKNLVARKDAHHQNVTTIVSGIWNQTEYQNNNSVFLFLLFWSGHRVLQICL